MQTKGRWLVILLISVFLKQIVLIFLIPAWQVPDEPAHVAYVQSVIEAKQWPVFSDQRMDMSPEMFRSMTAIEDSNPNRIGRHYPSGFLSVPAAGDRRMTNDGAPVRNLAARNSPLYYGYVGAGYVVTYPFSLETRLLTMRLLSALLLVGVVWLAVRIAVVLGQSPWIALAIGAVVGWHPVSSAIFSGVNPDTALALVATWCWWLLVSPSSAYPKRSLLIAVAVGLAAAIKPAGWFLAVPAFVWLGQQYRRRPRPEWARSVLFGGVVVAVLGGGWLMAQSWLAPSSVSLVEHPATGLAPARILNNDLFERPALVFRTWWGHLGWSGVSTYAYEWVYSLALLATLLAGVGTIVWCIRRWQAKSHLSSILVLLAGGLALEALYQYLYWQAGLRQGMTHFPVHGRYYTPLLVPFAYWFVVASRQALPFKLRSIGPVVVTSVTIVATITLMFQATLLYRLERLVG